MLIILLEAPAGRKKAGNNTPKKGIFLPKKVPFLTSEAPVGKWASSVHWLRVVLSRKSHHFTSIQANSWKTSHGNCHWLGAPKHDMWHWFDNNFILGLEKSILAQLEGGCWSFELVVSQCRCFGVFYWCLHEHCESRCVLKPKSHIYQQPSLENC